MMPTRTKPARKYTPPADSRLMHRAQKENFAIYLLRGMLANTVVIKSVIDPIDHKYLVASIKETIRAIKHEQAVRNPKRKIKP